MLVDIEAAIEPLRKQAELKHGNLYHLFFIGTLPEHQDQVEHC